MSRRNPTDDSKLESLERWRNSELDRAQVQHAKKQEQAQRKEDAKTIVQRSIDESFDLAREQTASHRVISVEALTRLRHYTTMQGEELKRAQSALDESREEAAVARNALLKKLEELSVVERLRKRRGAQADKESLRHEQRRLDDQALLRLSQTQRFKHKAEG